MIGFFPDIYPDELIYSQLARYYIRTGYTAYIFAAEDLYVKKTTRPNVEFLNHFTDDALRVITRHKTLKEIILQHTMFPYYGRFLKSERRIKAFNAMMTLEGNYHDLLSIPLRKNKRYLRYCPVCVSEDRKKYGETYWHRIHQMMGVDICPVHKCKLLNSEAAISSDYTPSLIPCELSVNQDTNITVSDNKAECEVAEYISTVFQSNLEIENKVDIGDFLHSELSFTKYKSVCGNKIYMALLSEDFKEKFKSLVDNSFTQRHQIEKVFSSYRTNTYEVCLLAMFLNIPPQKLINLALPEKTQKELFEEKIITLKNQGLNYRQISERLNASYDYVKLKGGKLCKKNNTSLL